MDFLELCQRTVRECEITGDFLTTVDQDGEFQEVVDWVNEAWMELQLARPNWNWMRSSRLLGAGASFQTVSGTWSYPLGLGAGTVGIAEVDFGRWLRETFRGQITTAGVSSELFLDWIDYDVWRDSYAYGAQQLMRTREVAIAIGPNNSVCLGPFPDSLNTITSDYMRGAKEMVDDTDVPTGLPEQFHMMIVYKAMQYYATINSAPEVLARGKRGYKGRYRRLTGDRVDEVSAGRTLV